MHKIKDRLWFNQFAYAIRYQRNYNVAKYKLIIIENLNILKYPVFVYLVFLNENVKFIYPSSSSELYL